MSLPNLPGNSFSKTVGQRTYNKSHHFDVSNEVGMWVGETKPGIGGAQLPGQRRQHFSVFPPGDGKPLPAWVAFDKRVLAFEGYFEETEINKNKEEIRVRPVKVYFYLEDDTVQVNEPLVENSGLAQGVLIRRHRIPIPEQDEKFYTADFFNIGSELQLYGRRFVLTDCDKFTFNFLTKMGVKVGQSVQIPQDQSTAKRIAQLNLMKPQRPYERIDTFGQFLEHDREVLCFNGYWDDTDTKFGDVHHMVLHYFLADDTVEVRELYKPNAGRDAVPVFLHRGKLPRDAPVAVFAPGTKTPRTVLNVCRTHHLLDSLKTGAVSEEYYTDADLRIGNVINIYGRPLKLVTCDEFTQQHYRAKFGVTSFAEIENKALSKAVAPVPRITHPYNGFGTEEDSLGSCTSLVPKPPQKDFIKFMQHDRNGLDSQVLRFVAEMDTDYSVDVGRRFIVSYFLSDDTLSVFEPPQRNSGVIGGKFLERGRAPLPNQQKFSATKTQYYSSADFFIGAKVIINRTSFVIVGADDYAISYMEACGYDSANIAKIEEKIKIALAGADIEMIKSNLAANATADGTVPFSSITPILSGLGLSTQEILTVARQFSVTAASDSDADRICRLVQEKLRKKHFDEFGRLLTSMKYDDPSGTGQMAAAAVDKLCKAFRIPISNEYLQCLIHTCSVDGLTDYAKFVSLINYKENPTRPCTAEDLAPKSSPPVNVPTIDRVNYTELFAKLAV